MYSIGDGHRSGYNIHGFMLGALLIRTLGMINKKYIF